MGKIKLYVVIVLSRSGKSIEKCQAVRYKWEAEHLLKYSYGSAAQIHKVIIERKP